MTAIQTSFAVVKWATQSLNICFENLDIYLANTANAIYFPRLCSDGKDVHLYYTTDNSRVYHQEELKSFEVNTEVDQRSCGNGHNSVFLFTPANNRFLPAYRCCRVSD